MDAAPLVGATHPAPVAATGVAAPEPVGATQLPEAEAVAEDAPAGVDCSLASNIGDGLPFTGRPLPCSKAAIAARVFSPMKPSAAPLR